MASKSISLSLTTKLRRALGRRGWSIRDLRPVNGGINAAFHVLTHTQQELFVKTRTHSEGGLAPEQYKLLAATGLPMPAMFGRYDIDEQHVCEVYAFVHGINAQKLWPALSTSARRLIARYLATFAATLHEISRSPVGVPVLNLVHRIEENTEALQDVIPVRHPLWHLIYGLPHATPARRFCHGDLNARNILMTADGAIFLVDWEWAAVAEPAFEFKNSRLAAARGFRELGHVKEYYERLTGRQIAESRLLIADIDYALVLLRQARDRGLTQWRLFHLKRLTRLAARLRRLI